MREHDVSALTARELERARREPAASLALTRPGSPARRPGMPGEAAGAGEAHAGTGLPAALVTPFACPGVRRMDPVYDTAYYEDLAGRLYGLVIRLDDRLSADQAQWLHHVTEVGEYGL